MKNILNRFLLVTLLVNLTTPLFGESWKDKLTLENCKTEFSNLGKKTKTFLTNKKNIKPAILLTISALMARNSINNKKEANKIYRKSANAVKVEKKYKIDSAFQNARENAAKGHFEQSIISGVISFAFGAWGLNSLINGNK